jgi:hypothetical protein
MKLRLRVTLTAGALIAASIFNDGFPLGYWPGIIALGILLLVPISSLEERFSEEIEFWLIVGRDD